jgi:hypothetical protein
MGSEPKHSKQQQAPSPHAGSTLVFLFCFLSNTQKAKEALKQTQIRSRKKNIPDISINQTNKLNQTNKKTFKSFQLRHEYKNKNT